MPLLTDTFDAFGLDIGDRSLKAAYVRRSGKRLVLKNIGSIEVEEGVFDRGALMKPDVLCRHVRQLVAATRPKSISARYVHACLPETQTFIKLLSLPDTSADELPAAIREELPRHIPLSMDELYVDWAVLPKQTESGLAVLVGAIPKKTSDAYTAALRQCGLVPVSLQIEAQAMLRALLGAEPPDDKALAVVDIGATRSSFVLYDRGSIQFTVTIPVASEDATAAIAAKLAIPMEEAERAKQTMGLDPQKGSGMVRNILMPLVSELRDAIQKNAAFYEERFAGSRTIKTVLLVGGGSLLPGLLEELQLALPGAAISFGNPGARLWRGEELGLNPSYTTAIGLALSNTL